VQTNVETVTYFRLVVRAVSDRSSCRLTFVTDGGPNFCNMEFCVTLENLKYPAAPLWVHPVAPRRTVWESVAYGFDRKMLCDVLYVVICCHIYCSLFCHPYIWVQ
jgi:hypothetical protein